MFKLLIVILFLSVSPLFARESAELLNEKAYGLKFLGKAFSSTSYFNYEGTETALNSGASFSMMDLDFHLSYGIRPNIEGVLLSKFRLLSSSDGTTEISNSGVESLGFIFKYALPSVGDTKYALGLRFKKTMYTNTTYLTSEIPPADQINLGDDGTEYGVDFYLTHKSSPYLFDLTFGYNSPPNDLSSEIDYQIKLGYAFSDLMLYGGFFGVTSLKRDQYSDTPTEKPLQTNGQSHQFNTINREFLSPFLGLNYKFKKSSLDLRAESIIKGKSFDKGNAFLASFEFNTDGITKEQVKIDSFKEYHIDASVLKVSARGNLVKIDQGLSTDVEKGMKFDIYQTDYFGGNVLVASGVVIDIGANWSIIKLLKKYSEIAIKAGFQARGY